MFQTLAGPPHCSKNIFKDGLLEQLQFTSQSVPSRAAGVSTEHLPSAARGRLRRGTNLGTPWPQASNSGTRLSFASRLDPP